ncbi:hypothetical protein DICVIV_10446 [Dictyocaulus viviparus]|uniref:Uncharacterized protein n=1 Tax=Dictyocaulus viviparus TaxID=29172 RepID=A0A0D8XFS7_DICVI|nr:hypothetical protein DICVIV_10446 [Dictyocaulus viviparus]
MHVFQVISGSDLPSTSNFDFDKLWCADSPKENTTPSRKSDNAAVSHFNGIAENESNSATPHRRRGMNRLSARRTRNKTEDPKLDEKKPVISGNFLSMEEGLAIGKASLVKLRQRLHSVGNSNIYKTSQDDNLCGLSPKKVSQNSPNVSPISSTTTSKRNTDVLLTPSMARTQNFSCSTPKTSLATPASLKRFRTMNDSSTCDQGERIKMARTKSMDDANDTSDDDSFLDDIFVPFTHPSQFVQMLKQGFLKK